MIDENGNVRHEVRLSHPIERVWKAISDREQLGAWLMTSDFEPRVGHQFHFDISPEQGTTFACEVVALDPPHRMQWQWIIDDVPTTVTIDLRADGDITVLNLEHGDIPTGPRVGFDKGWAEKFDALDLVLKEEG
jgi:uncharacterized protein YndB with AHSA1/START domain